MYILVNVVINRPGILDLSEILIRSTAFNDQDEIGSGSIGFVYRFGVRLRLRYPSDGSRNLRFPRMNKFNDFTVLVDDNNPTFFFRGIQQQVLKISPMIHIDINH